MLESKVKRKIVDVITANGGYARRFEDRYYVGLPDLLIAHRPIPAIMAEVKIFPGYKFSLSARQNIEMSRLDEMGGMLALAIGWKGGVYYLHSAPTVRDIHMDDCVTSEDIIEAINKWVRHVGISGQIARSSGKDSEGEKRKARTNNPVV